MPDWCKSCGHLLKPENEILCYACAGGDGPFPRTGGPRPSVWTMGGTEYPYLDPSQGHERDIELPWGRSLLRRCRGRILEVGNCTQANFPGLPARDIVCKYDELGGSLPVHREDIVDWEPGYRYNLALSLSTLEHVGYDYEEEPDPGKGIRAVKHCMSLLAPGGTLAFTVPCGFGGAIQDWTAEQDWTEIHLMVRASAANDWEEADVRRYSEFSYPGDWGCAGAVLFVRHRGRR